jgi:hypothetical protein
MAMSYIAKLPDLDDFHHAGKWKNELEGNHDR